MQIELHDQKLLPDKTKSQFFSVKPNNLEATHPTDTHTETKHTHYAVHRHGDRDRLTDARWDRHEDTIDLEPWLSRQEVGRNKNIAMQYR